MEQREQSYFCPQCGAPSTFRGMAVSQVCEYCESTIVRTDVDVALIGKVSAIVDTGSPVLLHARGKFNAVPFEIIGRLQIRYERGTWNEWYLEFADRSTGWLADFLGSYAVMKSIPEPPRDLPPYSNLCSGYLVSFNNKNLRVTDMRGASYQGAEGGLPFDARPGSQFYAADLRGPEGEFVSLDYGDAPENPPAQVYSGQSVTLDRLALYPRRRFEGWKHDGR